MKIATLLNLAERVQSVLRYSPPLRNNGLDEVLLDIRFGETRLTFVRAVSPDDKQLVLVGWAAEKWYVGGEDTAWVPEKIQKAIAALPPSTSRRVLKAARERAALAALEA